MRSSPTWASILKELPKCALRYFRPPGVSTVMTGMRSVRTVDATRRERRAQLVSAGATSRKVRAHCRGTGLWLSRDLVPPGAPRDSSAPLADFREGRTGRRRQALRNERH